MKQLLNLIGESSPADSDLFAAVQDKNTIYGMEPGAKTMAILEEISKNSNDKKMMMLFPWILLDGEKGAVIETSTEFLETLKQNVLNNCKDEVLNEVDGKDAIETLQELLDEKEQNSVRKQIEESFKKYIESIKEKYKEMRKEELLTLQFSSLKEKHKIFISNLKEQLDAIKNQFSNLCKESIKSIQLQTNTEHLTSVLIPDSVLRRRKNLGKLL